MLTIYELTASKRWRCGVHYSDVTLIHTWNIGETTKFQRFKENAKNLK